MAEILQIVSQENDLITWLQTKDSKEGFVDKGRKINDFKARKGKKQTKRQGKTQNDES